MLKWRRFEAKFCLDSWNRLSVCIVHEIASARIFFTQLADLISLIDHSLHIRSVLNWNSRAYTSLCTVRLLAWSSMRRSHFVTESCTVRHIFKAVIFLAIFWKYFLIPLRTIFIFALFFFNDLLAAEFFGKNVSFCLWFLIQGDRRTTTCIRG